MLGQPKCERATHSGADEAIFRPADAIAFEHAVEFDGWGFCRIGATAQGLALESFGEFGALRAFFDVVDHFAEGFDFFVGVKFFVFGGIVIVAEFFVDATVAHADDVAGREMH